MIRLPDRALRDRLALLLWGTKDFAFKNTERRHLEEALPNQRTVLLDASHFWQEGQPDVAVHEIQQLLRDSSEATDHGPPDGDRHRPSQGALRPFHSEPRIGHVAQSTQSVRYRTCRPPAR